MTHLKADMPHQTSPERHNYCGYSAMLLGAAAVIIAIAYFWAAPLDPQPKLERSIAELAVNVAKEVANVVRNKPAILEERPWGLDRIVPLIAMIAGALALVLAAFGVVRHEQVRPLMMGAALGGGAIAFQFVGWVAMMVCGLVLVWIVVSNLAGILGAGDVSA